MAQDKLDFTNFKGKERIIGAKHLSRLGKVMYVHRYVDKSIFEVLTLELNQISELEDSMRKKVGAVMIYDLHDAKRHLYLSIGENYFKKEYFYA
jgi:hypothetical protein